MMSNLGYGRLTLDELRGIALAHLVSGIDEDTPDCISDGATATSITGYTEWIGGPNTTLTVGWDWQVLPSQTLRLARVGWPSSNLMLQAGPNEDAGAATPQLLAAFIDDFDWQSETFRQICLRYAAN